MTFEDYCKNKNITLMDWQKDAVKAFLEKTYYYRERASGKTFLCNLLSDFIYEHGNNFEIKPKKKTNEIIGDILEYES